MIWTGFFETSDIASTMHRRVDVLQETLLLVFEKSFNDCELFRANKTNFGYSGNKRVTKSSYIPGFGETETTAGRRWKLRFIKLSSFIK